MEIRIQWKDEVSIEQGWRLSKLDGRVQGIRKLQILKKESNERDT